MKCSAVILGRHFLLMLAFVSVVILSGGCEKRPEKKVESMTLSELTSASERGNPAAMVILGLHYDTGREVPQNIDEALKWYQKAAALGSAEGEERLGYNYFTGRGVKQDYAEALKWFQLAAEKNIPMAQMCVGEMYLKGLGVQKNEKTAFDWFMRAANQGYGAGQNEVGLCLLRGIGAETNFAEAVVWLRKSAEGGFVKAQIKLAECYGDGIGVEQNPQEAFVWYRAAAHQGDVDSERITSIFYARAPITDDKNDDLIESYKWIVLTRLKSPESAEIALKILAESGVSFTPEQMMIARNRADEFVKTNKAVLP